MQIVLPVIALMIAAGAWSAWRRNPLYSHKATLQAAGVMVLLVVLVAGATLAFSSIIIGVSPAILVALTIAGVLVISTGASVAIVQITDRHVAQLPPEARIVTTHRHRIDRWIWRVVVFLSIGAAAGWALWPSSWAALPLSLDGFVAVGCSPTLAILYLRARRFDRGITALLSAYWVHWQYTAQEWESWAESQLAWERAATKTFQWRRDWRKPGLAILIFAGCAALFGSGGVGERAAVFAVSAGLVVALLGSMNSINRRVSERSYRRLLAALREVYFGSEGLYWAGEYAPWTLSGNYLLEAAAESDPPVRLTLIFQTMAGATPIKVTRRIPIPEGRLPDLTMLQQKLRECCPKARISLVGR